jgi:hypothetical protein
MGLRDRVTPKRDDARMNADRLVVELSMSQGGAVRLEQALEFGMTRDQVKHRLRTGRWSALVRGSYLVAPMITAEDYLRAAVASLPNAVVSHEAAAELHGLSYVKRGLATVMVYSQTTHEFPGVTIRRSHDLAPDHLFVRNGLPVTTAPRTIVDLAAVVSRRNLAAILDDAVAAKLTAVPSVASVAEAVGRSGKPGTKNLRSVLEERLESGLIGTPLENKGNALLLTIEEATPTFEYAIPWRPEHRFDAAYPVNQLAIEWDSLRWHLQRSAFDRDRARDREAIAHGWRVLRFTWSDVTERPDEVVATVRDALAVARP